MFTLTCTCNVCINVMSTLTYNGNVCINVQW